MQRLVAERERLVAEMSSMAVKVWPSGANFVLFRPEEHSGEVVWRKLVDRSVLVRNCASWPPPRRVSARHGRHSKRR